MAEKIWEFHGEIKLDFAVEVKAPSPRKALELAKNELEARLTEVVAKHKKVAITDLQAPMAMGPHYGFMEVIQAFDENGQVISEARYE